MDPNLLTGLTTVLAGILGGATGEVGSESVHALLALIKRAPEDASEPVGPELEQAVLGGQADRAQEIADYLAAAAREDQAFAHDLKAWVMAATEQLEKPTVNNTITGPVSGKVIQGGEINIDSITWR